MPETPIQRVLRAFPGAAEKGSIWRGRCKNHDDEHPSVDITVGSDGVVLILCRAGCETRDVLAAHGLTWPDLFPEHLKRKYGELGEIVAVYTYCDEHANPSFQSVRFQPLGGEKTFRLRRPDGTWKLGGAKLCLYRLPQVLQAKAEKLRIFVVEGEKDADNLARLGLTATTNPLGATTDAPGGKKWKREYTDTLAGTMVTIIPDNDEPGRRHAENVARSLYGRAEFIEMVNLPGLPPKGDVSDWLAAGGTREQLEDLADAADEWKPTLQPEAPPTTTGDEDGAAAAPRSRAVTLRLCDVEPEELRWLWPGRIPQRKLSLLDGDPGLGKSLVTLDLAARVSMGAEMPDGCENGLGEPAGVVLLGVEDGLGDTVVPRLQAAGADLSRIVALTGKAPITPDQPADWVTTADLGTLEDAIREVDARLLVIDPLTGFLPEGTDSHNDAQVRAALSPLCPLAERTGCAILLVRHLNKAPGGSPLYRGGGSIAIIGIARSGMVVGPDPNDTEGVGRILAMSKSNLAAPAASLAYRVEETGAGVVVQWEGEVSMTAAELLAAPKSVSPERAEVIGLLEESGKTLDAQQIAEELDWPAARVRYHLSKAAAARQIDRVGTGQYAARRQSSRPSQAHNAYSPHRSVEEEGASQQQTCEPCEDCEPVRGVSGECASNNGAGPELLFEPGPLAEQAARYWERGA